MKNRCFQELSAGADMRAFYLGIAKKETQKTCSECKNKSRTHKLLNMINSIN